MKFRSIRIKLIRSLALTIVLVLGLLTAIQSVHHRTEAMRNAEHELLTLAQQTSSQIASHIQSPLAIAQSMAILLGTGYDPHTERDISNKQASRLFRTLLNRHPFVAAIGVVWNPDTRTGDQATTASLRRGAEASIPGVYWTRGDLYDTVGLSDSEIALRYSSDAYQTVQRGLREAVLSPRPVSIGYKECMLVPVVAPVLHEGKFLGMVEMLIATDSWVQPMVDSVAKTIPKIRITLVAADRRVAAESNTRESVGKIWTELSGTSALDREALSQGGGKQYYEGDRAKLAFPVAWEHGSAPWMLIFDAPESFVLGQAQNQMWTQIIFGLAMLAIVLLMTAILVGKYLRPLVQISRQMDMVAEGDLLIESVETEDDEIGVAYTALRRVVESLREITEVCEAVAQGDVDQHVDVRGEKDRLGQAINEMSAVLRATVGQSEAIAGGDYETIIAPRSDRDQIGMSLYRMTHALRAMARQNTEQNWIKTGENGFNDRLRGETRLDVLLARALSYLAEYVNAQMGALYILEEDNRLHLVQGYAYRRRKHLANRIDLGEGLVGQAALEREAILLTDVPEDYVSVSSATGEHPPRNILVLPLVHEDTVKGVVEFGSLEEFPAQVIEFLKTAATNLAIALQSAQSRERMQALLERTQQQSEELQAQQEELRQANEELEEQTRVLRESEQRLQTQQEDLERTNTELEDRTAALEREKNAVAQKNRELEAARQIIEQKARDLERTSKYKSEFLANMSHELRTPLNSLLILSKLLMDNKDGNLTSKQVDFARTINHSGSDLLGLINDILDLSKIESGKMPINLDDVRLSDFAHGVEQNFRHVAEQRGLSFGVELAGPLPETIRIDEQRLGQIIKNLLSNAFKFTEKGRVTLVIGRPKFSDLPPHLPADASVAFTVRDTGIGIPEDKRQIIFEAFQQADGTTMRRFGGTGLGLSICREITHLLAGEIRLESKVGEGSAFSVIFAEKAAWQEGEDAAKRGEKSEKPEAPLIVPSAASSEVPAAPALKPPEPAPGESPAPPKDFVPDDRANLRRGDRSILIIEDDPAFARILVDLTHEKGFQALAAGDGETGLHLADYYMPSAILLDLGLPGIDGMTVMDRLKENLQTRHIPVHIISGSEKASDALRMGAVGFLRKPVNMQEMDDAFQRIERLSSHAVRELLVVEDDAASRNAIVAMLNDDQVHVTTAASGEAALKALRTQTFDCMVLDLRLPDMTGADLLEDLRADENMRHVPVIVFTGKELDAEEKSVLDRYAERIIVKDARSPERLLDETTLFLHQVERKLPVEKQRIIEMLHDKEAILRGRRVLLVDDDMRNVFALTSVLEDKGLEIRVAKNGREALEKIEAQPDMELVVMDIMMPEMDGYEAMRRIRAQERFRNLPIIALTAKAMKGDRAKCIEAGANDYLAKPVDTDKLLSMLRVWLYR